MIRDSITSVLRAAHLMTLINRASNFRYWVIKKYCEMVGKDDLARIYSEKYFEVETNRTVPTAPAVVDILAGEFAPTSVFDIGCGTAVYLAEFQKRGVEVSGIEGSENAIRHAHIDAGLIRQVDLRESYDADCRYDLVTCFEVAEHIDGQYADTVAGTIARAGKCIVFSAAQPGQGGVDHINEQPSSYWIEKFERHSVRYDEEGTQRIRKAFKERGCVWWLELNALVFRADA